MTDANRILKKALWLNALGLVSVPFVFNFIGSKIFLEYLEMPVLRSSKIFWSVVILLCWFVSFFSFFYSIRWLSTSLHTLPNLMDPAQ